MLSARNDDMGQGALDTSEIMAAQPTRRLRPSRRPFHRTRLACGLVGPLAFTAAWLISTTRQEGLDGYSLRRQHISGLGAPDARSPRIMNAGFLSLGICTITFASAVAESPASRRQEIAPRLLGVAGAATLAAGILHRDRMLLEAPEGGPPAAPSWHNRGHDLASVVAYACMIAGPVVLESAFGRSAAARTLRAPGHMTSLITALALGVFASRLIEEHNGVLQRLAVSLPLLSMVRVAWLLLKQDVRKARRPSEGG